jgi:hypothetical protein
LVPLGAPSPSGKDQRLTEHHCANVRHCRHDSIVRVSYQVAAVIRRKYER